MRTNRLYFNVLVSHLDLVFCVMGHMERGGKKNPFMSDQCLFIKIRAQLYIIWPSCKVLICCEYQGGGKLCMYSKYSPRLLPAAAVAIKL